MDIEKLFLERQSCRNYSNRIVEKETLEEVIRLASLAPSACNSQPWKVICVTGDKAKEFASCVQGMGANKFTSNCNAFFVIIETKANLPERVGAKFTDSAFVENDIGIFVAHIILSAKEMGLGTCILGWRSVDKIAEFLHLGKKVKIPLVVSVGYPAEDDELRTKKRKPMKEIFEYFE